MSDVQAFTGLFGSVLARAVSTNRKPPLQQAPTRPQRRSQQHRTIWISDTHLGTPGCKAELLLDFLRNNDCDLLYLVGDIIDGWRLTRSWYWNHTHDEIVREILAKAHAGTRVIYIPGNHDEAFRAYAGLCFAGIELAGDAIHETATGTRLLVLHGDHFDGIVTYARWLAFAGDRAYNAALRLNDWVATIRRWLGLPYWSLSRWLKDHVKQAVEYTTRFEEAIVLEAQRRQVDGVVCGHIHKAEVRRIGPILYCNDGDWVESCTALVESDAGELRILHWTELAPVALPAPSYASAA